MIRTALAVLVAGSFVLPSSVVAQKQSGFSGKWKINTAKSDPPPQRGGGGGGPEWAGMTLVVTQTAEAIKVEQTMGERMQTMTYYLDGRESTNSGMRGAEMKSTSKWDGAALVTTGSTNIETPQGAMEIKTKETRTLSADGKTMTVVTVRQTPRGEQTRTTVFDKQ